MTPVTVTRVTARALLVAAIAARLDQLTSDAAARAAFLSKYAR